MRSNKNQRRPGNFWRAAVPMLGLALACLSTHTGAIAADDATDRHSKAGFDPNGCVRPEWPKGALEAKHAGTVTLAMLIGEDGKVRQSKVTKSSGHEDLDEAARDSIAKCKFNPGKRDGKPQEAWLQMQYVWTLD